MIPARMKSGTAKRTNESQAVKRRWGMRVSGKFVNINPPRDERPIQKAIGTPSPIRITMIRSITATGDVGNRIGVFGNFIRPHRDLIIV
jgi:hypothetical protein